MPALLHVDDLHIRFPRYARALSQQHLTVVSGMSLHVGAGEVVALVGASGAGKSLLAYSVLGFLPNTAVETGTVTWRGDPLTPAGRRALAGRELVLLPQQLTALDPTATVGAQVRRSATLVGQAHEDALRTLLASGLEQGVERLYPHQLSGGMARRVLRTMALLGDPALVIADEPTPGLGRGEADEVLDHLRGLADSGKGVLLITHDIGTALRITDRVVVALEGRTVDEAPATDFIGAGEQLGHPYTRALWNALPGNAFTGALHANPTPSTNPSPSPAVEVPHDAPPTTHTSTEEQSATREARC